MPFIYKNGARRSQVSPRSCLGSGPRGCGPGSGAWRKWGVRSESSRPDFRLHCVSRRRFGVCVSPQGLPESPHISSPGLDALLSAGAAQALLEILERESRSRGLQGGVGPPTCQRTGWEKKVHPPATCPERPLGLRPQCEQPPPPLVASRSTQRGTGGGWYGERVGTKSIRRSQHAFRICSHTWGGGPCLDLPV